MSGAETTAGSIRSRRSSSGRAAATVADQRQIARIVSATTTADVRSRRRAARARPKATTAMIAAEDQPDPQLLEDDPRRCRGA